MLSFQVPKLICSGSLNICSSIIITTIILAFYLDVAVAVLEWKWQLLLLTLNRMHGSANIVGILRWICPHEWFALTADVNGSQEKASRQKGLVCLDKLLICKVMTSIL